MVSYGDLPRRCWLQNEGKPWSGDCVVSSGRAQNMAKERIMQGRILDWRWRSCKIETELTWGRGGLGPSFCCFGLRVIETTST